MNKFELKGKTFTAIRTLKGYGIEDIPALRESFQSQIAGIPDAKMTETDTAFEFNNGQFFLKPKAPKVCTGKLVCGATFAKFENCRIEYSSMTMSGKVIETEFASYVLQD